MTGNAILLTEGASVKVRKWVERETSSDTLELAIEQASSLTNVLERPGMPATWCGSAAASFGLCNQATQLDIISVFENGVYKSQKLRSNRKIKNITFGSIIAAPKSISALLAHPELAVRQAVDTAMDAAADEYIIVLERLCRSRQEKQGIKSIPIAGIFAVRYRHRTFSTGDPHAHQHILIASSALCRDGKYRTIDSRTFLSAKRIAEAAAMVAMKKSLDSDLELNPTAWEWKTAGCVRTPNLIATEAATEYLSGAMRHIDEVLAEAGKVFGDLTYREASVAWRQHRVAKGALAEKVEYEIDSALSLDGHKANAIRQMWYNRAQGMLNNLCEIKIRSQPLIPCADCCDAIRQWNAAKAFVSIEDLLNSKISKLSTELIATGKKIFEEQSKLDIAKKNILREETGILGIFNRIFRPTKIYGLKKIVDLTIRQIQKNENNVNMIKNKIGKLNRNIQIDKDRQVAAQFWNNIEIQALTFLTNAHTWTISDLAAWLTPIVSDGVLAWRLAGTMANEWQRSGIIIGPACISDITEAIAEGRDCSTADVHQKVGALAKMVTTQAVQLEGRLCETASVLASEPSEAFLIDLGGLSTEQASAAQLISQGRILTIITGVAGAGKTTILERVATGAIAKGMWVVSVARNASRAYNTGEAIKAHQSMSISAFLNQGTRCWSKGKPVLLVIDEAGVVDATDLEKLLALAEIENMRIVAVGDREQAQPIDRRAAWATIVGAAAQAGAHAHLKTSYRCRAWAIEAGAIRSGQSDVVAKTALAEGRITALEEKKLAEIAAQKVYVSDDSIALTISNEEVAAISRKVQHLRGIEVTTPIARDCHCGVGDRVRTRQNDYKLAVHNGDRWSVKETKYNGNVIVQDSRGRIIELSASYCRRYLELDYACTIDSAQGITVGQAICVLREGMGRSYLYSSATRGRTAPDYLIVGADDSAKVLRQIIASDDLARTATELAANWAVISKLVLAPTTSQSPTLQRMTAPASLGTAIL